MRPPPVIEVMGAVVALIAVIGIAAVGSAVIVYLLSLAAL